MSETAYDRGAKLLAQRPHFRSQLRTKLAARGYDPAEVEAALDRLAAHGYLDDLAAARDFVAAKLRREPLGRRRLQAELARRGAPAEIVDRVLGESLPDSDAEACRQAAERWRAKRRGEPDPAALARYLERRGFSPGSIWDEVERIGREGGGGED